MAGHNDFGRRGEEIAKKYFLTEGYELMDQNWTIGKAEVDLIFYKDGIIVFAEVKTRSSDNFGDPEVFITEQKVNKLAYAATEYIELMDHHGEVRFDVVSILFEDKDNYKLHHIDDAFWPD